MSDNFNLKKYLIENQLGPFAKTKITESAVKTALLNQALEDGDVEFEKLLNQAGYEEYWTGDIKTTVDSLSDDAARELLDDPYDPTEDETTGFGSASGPIDEATSYGRAISNLGMLEDHLTQLLRNTATNSNIPTEEKQDLLYTFKEMKDLVLQIGSDMEQGDSGYFGLKEDYTEQVVDVRATLKALQAAVRSGATVTIDDEEVFKMPMINIATLIDGGTVQLPMKEEDLEIVASSILVDSRPLELIYKPAPVQAARPNRTPFNPSAYSDPESIYYRGGD